MKLRCTHLSVLRFAAPLGPELLTAVEEACIGAEVAAAEASQPTPGAHDFLALCRRAEKPVIIVSNNAAKAVHTYLMRFKLHGLVRGVVGRQLHRPDLMKPHPSLIGAALDLAQYPVEACVFIGDSVTDAQVAAAVQMHFIGYAKTPRRGAELHRAGATILTSAMSELIRPGGD